MKSFPNHVTVTDQEIDISGFSTTWKERVNTLAEQIGTTYHESRKERYIVAIGGASGSSKSTTTKVLETILRSREVPATAVSQDGYHFSQDYLLHTMDHEGKPLADHKGRFDSFDVAAMKNDLEQFVKGENISFPAYSRRIHDPIPHAISVTSPTLLLLEGLWLLYDQIPWRELLPLYDLTIFFHADESTRRQNAVTRHVRGSERTEKEAEDFYDRSDAENAKRILESVAKHDLDFSL